MSHWHLTFRKAMKIDASPLTILRSDHGSHHHGSRSMWTSAVQCADVDYLLTGWKKHQETTPSGRIINLHEHAQFMSYTVAPAAISNVKGFKNWRKVSNCETIPSNSKRKDLNISIRAVTLELLYWIYWWYWCSFVKLVPLIFHLSLMSLCIHGISRSHGKLWEAHEAPELKAFLKSCSSSFRTRSTSGHRQFS